MKRHSLPMTTRLIVLTVAISLIASFAEAANRGSEREAEAALPSSSTPATVTAGAYIVDMGVSSDPSTDLLMYGLIYELVTNRKVPVTWAIKDDKAKNGVIDEVDFTVNGKDYRGGAFIIPPEFAADALSTITTYRGMGLTIDGPITSSFEAPEFATIKSWPKAVLDADKGSLAAPYYVNANVPTSSYRVGLPSGLTSCDDIYVMPHADPTWATHKNLVQFNTDGGYIWAACHAVSVLENVDNPASTNPAPDMNFLSVNGLIPFKSHGNGDGAYNYNTPEGSDPIFQFIGDLDSATENGSEQIYIPKAGGGWRSTSNVLVWDDNHPDAVASPAGGPPGLGEAAKLVYGRGFGNDLNGLVMYEGGHSHIKGDDEDVVSAQRAFFNLHLLAGIERGLKVDVNVPPTIAAGATVPVSATISGGSELYSYTLTASCAGGSFGTASGSAITPAAPRGTATISTTFTAPAGDADCIVRLNATDSCGRTAFAAAATAVREAADISITKVDDVDPAQAGSALEYTLTVANAGPAVATNVIVTDTLPSEVSLVSANPGQGSCQLSSGNVVCDLGAIANAGSTTISLIVTIDTGYVGQLSNSASVTADQPDPNSGDNTAVETTDVSLNGLEIVKVATPANVNLADNPTGAPVTYTFEVTNTVTTALSAVTVADDTCSPVNPIETAGFNDGDTNTNGTLDQGEVWKFACTTNVAVDTTNTASASAIDPVLGSISSPTTTAYVDTFTPSLAIDKGPDPTAFAPQGGAAIFNVVVQNTGDVALDNVVVSDPTAPECDRTFSTLAPNQFASYQCTFSVVGLAIGTAGTNTISVTGTPPAGTPPTDSDTADWEVVAATLSVNKTVTSPTPAVLYPGDPVSYQIEVTNTGSTVQNDVLISDALPNTVGPYTVNVAATKVFVNEDFLADTGSSTNPYANGWIDENGKKVDGDIYVARDTDKAAKPCPDTCVLRFDRKNKEIYLPVDLTTSGDITITFDYRVQTFNGSNVDDNGVFDVVAGIDTDSDTDADDGYVSVLGIPITFAAGPSTTFSSKTITFTPSAAMKVSGGRLGFATTNFNKDHAVHIDNIVMSTNQTFTGGNPPNLVTAANNIQLTPGSTVTVTVDATVDPAIPVSIRTLENTTTASSNTHANVVDVANVTVINPAVSLTKTASKTVVAAGQPVTYSIKATNNGNDPLTPTVTDADCPPAFASGDINSNSKLDPDEIWTYTCTTTSPVPLNTATVVAVDSQGKTVPPDADDTATATVDVVTSSINITTTPSATVVRPGSSVTYTYAVTTNGSPESLSAVSVSDDTCSPATSVVVGSSNTGDTNTNGKLDQGETWQFTCTRTLASTTTNTATATGADRVGSRPADTDPATVTVITPAMSLVKTKAAPAGDPLPGATVTYQYDVANTGNDVLATVTPSDNLCSPLARGVDVTGNNDAALDVGETWRFTCDQVLNDDTTNYATVTAIDSLGGPVKASDELFVNVIVPALTLGIEVTPIVQYIDTNPLATDAIFTYKIFNSGETDFPNFANAPTTTISDDTCAPQVRGADVTGDNDDDLEVGETWSYTCRAPTTAETVNHTFTTTGTDATSTMVTAPPVDASVTGIDPSMSVTKVASADTVRPNTNVTYTYEARNTSAGTGITQSFISDVSISDDKCSPVSYVSGDDGDGELGFDDAGVTEVWVFTCTSMLMADTTNIATLTATDTLGAAVPQKTASRSVDVINPAIKVVATAGNAPDGTTEFIESGDDVTYKYVVTNAGDDPLSSVTLGDSVGCSPITGPTGDTGADGILGLTETWTYSCTSVGVTADVTNTATVGGTDSLSGPVGDTDPAIVEVVAPGISLAKTAYIGTIASGSCPGAASVVGDDSPADDLTYCFTVTNTGNTHLSGVSVDDVTLGIDDGDMTLTSGSQTPTLEPGGVLVWEYQTTVGSGALTNNAMATGNPTSATGVDLPGLANPTGGGSATVLGVDPALTIEKTVTAGSTCPGVEALLVGLNQPLTYCFVVTNAGDTHLKDIVINDTPLGSSLAVTPDPSTLAPIAPDEAVTFSYATTATADLINTATATATPSDAGGAAYVSVDDPLSAPDSARVDVVTPDISLAKTVAWGTGASCPGDESIPARNGDTVTYCFDVTNTGETFLDNIAISDPQLGGTLAISPDPSTITLGLGDSQMFSIETLVDGDLLNIASVTADPVDSSGTAIPGATAPRASNSASVDEVAPAITITKSVYGAHDSGASCVGASSVIVPMDTSVTFCFVVANTGDTALGSVSISDPELGIDDTDMIFVTPGSFPLAVGESATLYYEWSFNEVTATHAFTNNVAVTADPVDGSGDVLPNIPSVGGSASATVTATDPGIVIAKTVYLGHDGGVGCDGGELARGGVGADVTYCFSVSNSGGTYLSAVTVDDAQLGIDVDDLTLLSGSFPLAPGATAVYYYDTTITSSLINTANVGATASDAAGTATGQAVTAANDTAEVQVPVPSMTVDKTLYIGHDSGAACDGAETLSGGSGLEVTYCFTVTNTGDTHLSALSLVDANLSITKADMTALGATWPLAPSATATFYYETTTGADLVNTVNASANPVESSGADIPKLTNPTASDTATYTASAVSLSFDKTVYADADSGASCAGVKTQHVGAAQALTYCFTVTNTGDAPTYLDSIDITDTGLGITQADLSPVGGSPTLPLAPGASITYYYETTASVDQSSTADVTSNPVDSSGIDLPGLNDQTGSSSASVVIVAPAISIEKTVFWGTGGTCPGVESVPGLNGDAVTYCYRVTNTGNVDLDPLTMVDALDGGLTEADWTLVSGTAPLEPAQSAVFYYETTIDGDVNDLVTVTGIGVDSAGNPVPGAAPATASDAAGVDEVAPAVTVDNTVYAGSDGGASCAGADAATVDVGDAVVYCFTVKNTGDTWLADLTLDNVALGIGITDLTLVSGAASLAPGAEAVYAYSTTASVDLNNTMDVSADPVDALGGDLANIPSPTHSDASSVDTVTPAMTISKTIYAGHDAGGSCGGSDSLRAGAGQAVTYCFLVTNTGDTSLDDVVITDVALNIPATTTVVPDPATVLPIAPLDSVMFHVEVTVAGDLVNTAAATATPTDPSGSPYVDVAAPTATPDTATVDEVAPAVAIGTTVYVGHDAGASCTGEELVSGGSGLLITYCFAVTNTGDTHLSDLVLTDSDLGISESDMTVLSGDPLVPLAPGATIIWYYQTTISADLVNTATVEGRATDSLGIDIAGAVLTPASDPAEVDENSVAIDLVKSVYPGHNGGVGCQGTELLFAATGSPITYCFAVTNTSLAPTYLDDITIEDAGLGITRADLTKLGGNGPIAPGETVVFFYELTATMATSDAETSATATDSSGTALPGITDPTDSSTAGVEALAVEIKLEKTVSPTTANAGDSVTFTFVVTNPGEASIKDVDLTDAQCTAISGPNKLDGNSDNLLEPGETWEYKCDRVVTADLTNTATVAGVGVCPAVSPFAFGSCPAGTVISGGDVSATDTAAVDVLEVDLSVVIKLDTPLVPGQNATYTLTMDNGGPDTATNAFVDITLPPGLTFVSAVGEGWTCAATSATNVRCTKTTMTPGSPSTISLIGAVSSSARDSLSVTATIGGDQAEPIERLLNNRDDASGTILLPTEIPKENPPKWDVPKSLPKTGSDSANLVDLAMILFLAGLLLVGLSRRDRRTWTA